MQGKIVKCETCGGPVRLIAPKGTPKRETVASCFREAAK